MFLLSQVIHQPARITPRTEHRVLNDVINDPRGPAEDLQKTLELITISDISTILKINNQVRSAKKVLAAELPKLNKS